MNAQSKAKAPAEGGLDAVTLPRHDAAIGANLSDHHPVLTLTA